MASSMLVKVSCLYMICLVLVIPLANAALSCPQVEQILEFCLQYVRLPPGLPPLPEECCNEIRTLNDETQTTPDRQNVCRCLQLLITHIPDINIRALASIPSQCGVDLHYEISSNMDCDKYISPSTLFFYF
jgi:hypothetical protein